MDAATADALAVIAVEAQARTRRQDPGARGEVEAGYPDMLDALDWYVDAGRHEAAYRLAKALVSFWMASKGIDDGDTWSERALARTPGDDPSRAGTLYEHGYLDFFAGRHDLGNPDRAEALALQALAIDAVRGDEMSIAWTLNSVAAVAAAKGDLERAAVLVGLGDTLLESAGGEWPTDEREQHAETVANLSAGLPADVLAAARARGGAMSVEAGVDFALGAPDRGGTA